MTPKQLEKIDLADLNQLKEYSVAEGKTIEYKQKLPTDSDKDKTEFIADVSSFANASGGDLFSPYALQISRYALTLWVHANRENP